MIRKKCAICYDYFIITGKERKTETRHFCKLCRKVINKYGMTINKCKLEALNRKLK